MAQARVVLEMSQKTSMQRKTRQYAQHQPMGQAPIILRMSLLNEDEHG